MAGEIKDPTTTGPVGLRGLKALQQQLSLEGALKLQELQNLNHSLRVAIANNPMAQDLTKQAEAVGYGDSIYDTPTGDINFLDDLNETRALNQPWLAKVGGGILKGTSLAATTFLDTFAGTAAGIINAAATGTFSGLWDNPVTQGFNSWNENLEKLLPNYYTAEETKNRENGEWYKNIFTANFIGDTLLKNTGFMVGAALSGKVVAGAAAKLMQLAEARKAYEGYAIIANDGRKAANLTEKLKMVATGDATIDGAAITLEAILAAKKLRGANQQLKIIGATSGALGEARLEAVSNSKEYAERLEGLLLETLPLIVEEELKILLDENPEFLELDGTLTQEGIQELKGRVDDRYKEGLAKIEELRAKFGNRDFTTNFALLAGSDYVLFGRMYAGGFKPAVKAKNIVGAIKDGLTVNKPSLLKKAWAIAKTPLVEGPIEEMGLATIAKTLNQYYGAEFNSFMGHLIDPNANKESIDWLNAIGQGAKETYGTMAGWEEGFVGALIGGIGMPSVINKAGKNGKTSHSIIMNGAIGEVKQLNLTYKEDLELAEALNIRWQDPKFLEYYKANNRRLSFGADKEAALENKDEFEFKNAEHSELISDAILFDKVGRIQDLYDHVESMNNLSDEDIAGIREDLTKKGNEQLPYQNKTDEELRQYFKERATRTKETIDNYRLIADDLSVKSGDTFKGDDLSELVWMLSKVDNWEKRFHQVHKDLSESLKPIVKQLNGGVYKDADEVEQPIDEVLNLSPGDLLAALQDEASKLGNKINRAVEVKRNRQERVAKTSAGRVIMQEALLSAKEDNRGRPQASAKLERLKKELELNLTKLKDSGKMIELINDLLRLSSARISFLNRYNQYIANPERLKLDLKRVVAEAKKEEVKIDNADIKEKKDVVDEFTTYEEYRDYLNTTFPVGKEEEARDFNTQMIASGNEFAKLHKDLSLNALNVKDKINMTKANPDVKEAANLVFDRLLKRTTNTNELLDLKNTESRDLYEDLVLGKGNLVSTDDLALIQKLVKEAVANAKKDHDLLNKNKVIPNNNLWTPEDGIIPPTEEVPGKDLTPVAPLTNEGTIVTTPTETTPTPQPEEEEVDGEPNLVWWNPIAEFDVNEKKKGNFIPSKEIYPHTAELYDYFTQKHTWDYLNKPNEKGEFNIKEGDEVRFMINPSFRRRKPLFADVIFIVHGPNNQIIGSLHAIKDAHRFAGLLELRDRIEKEFMDSGVTDKPFISSETTVIGKVNGGYVELKRGADTNLNDKSKNVDKKNLVFSIASKGLDFYFAHPTISPTQITPPNKPGMVYMHEKMADGNYASVPMTIKTFNKLEFDRADVTTLANPLFHTIEEAVDMLAKAKQIEDVDAGYAKLSLALFLGESKVDKDGLAISSNKLAIHISLSKDKSTLIIRRDELGADGIYRETGVDKIFLTEADKNPNDIFPPKNLKRNDVESIKDLIYESLYKNDILFNVDASKINTPGYNEMLYDSNILKTAMVESGVKTVWFYLLAKTPSGTPIAFVAPSLEQDQAFEGGGKKKKGIPLVVPKMTTVNPVVASESVIKGTKVTKSGTDYFVDNGVVTDEDGKVITNPITTKPILDLAYIKDGFNGKFGPTFEKDHRVSKDEWKVLDGSIFNVVTMDYRNNGLMEGSTESTPKSTPSSSPLGIKLKRDPNLMGSFGEKSTDFKNSQTNAPKNLEMSKKIPNFAKLDGSVRIALSKAKWTAEKFDALNDKEKEHAIKCVM